MFLEEMENAKLPRQTVGYYKMKSCNFSVLISIYHKENPQYFEEALESVLNQTLPPDEVVIVEDGPIGEGLESVVKKASRRLKERLKVVKLKTNRGLGVALQEGLLACTYPIVARMDADDIALPERFEKECRYLDEHPDTDLVGGWIAEFSESPEKIDAIRKVPTTHSEILAFSRFRNPMNHMTVMFRKDAVLDVGGYRSFPGFEDYHLWVRMLKSGKRMANLDEVLVYARTGSGMIKRRRGTEYALQDWRLQRYFYKIGHIGLARFAGNVTLRVLPRLMPEGLTRVIYRLIRR